MPGSPLSVIKFRIVFSIWWMVLMANHAFVLYLLDIPFTITLIDSGISNSLLFLFCLLIINTIRYLPQRDQYSNLFISCILFTTGWFFLVRWLLSICLGSVPFYETWLLRSMPIRASIAFLIIGCVAMASVLWYNEEEQKQQEARKTDAEKLAREAELFRLRQQLHPHFLFNSLNSISALAGSQPSKAREMIQQLSDFLRGTLKKEEQDFVPLQEEINNLQLYLDIEKVRFGHRLQTSVIIEDRAAIFLLPSLLLQPIVENAIKFGLYDTIGSVNISIYACTEKDQLIITIANPFDPETSKATGGTGFGLSSIQRRLFLLYARNDLLHTKIEGNLFTTELIIPQRYQSE